MIRRFTRKKRQARLSEVTSGTALYLGRTIKNYRWIEDISQKI